MHTSTFLESASRERTKKIRALIMKNKSIKCVAVVLAVLFLDILHTNREHHLFKFDFNLF